MNEAEIDGDYMMALEYEAEYDEENDYEVLSKEESAERIRLFLAGKIIPKKRQCDT